MLRIISTILIKHYLKKQRNRNNKISLDYNINKTKCGEIIYSGTIDFLN